MRQRIHALKLNTRSNISIEVSEMVLLILEASLRTQREHRLAKVLGRFSEDEKEWIEMMQKTREVSKS